jgi:hypothetical protein
MNKLFICLCALLICGATANAQDKLYRKNGEILKVKVLEVSSTEVKYRLFGKPDDSPIYVLERDRIKKIVYEDGREEKATATLDLKDPEQYLDQKKNALKINFLGPLVGFTQISYERSTGVGKSFEVGLTIIGAGKNRQLSYDYYYNNTITEKNMDQFGFAIAGGYKFNKLPDFLFGKTRFTHLMQGAYVKPMLYIGNYKENVLFYKTNTQTYVIDRQNVTFGALQIELGKQWVFGDSFVLDWYGGFGYGVDNKNYNNNSNNEDNTTAYNYLNARLGKSPGFSVNGGLKLGFLFK